MPRGGRRIAAGRSNGKRSLDHHVHRYANRAGRTRAGLPSGCGGLARRPDVTDSADAIHPARRNRRGVRGVLGWWAKAAVATRGPMAIDQIGTAGTPDDVVEATVAIVTA